MKYLRTAPFHPHNIYRTIQKENEEDPFASASLQGVRQSGKWNTYVLLHSIRTIFNAWFKKKKKKIHPHQHRSKKQANQINEILTSCSSPFPQYLPRDSKRKETRSLHISIAARSESIRQNQILTACSIPSTQHPNQPTRVSIAPRSESIRGKSNTYVFAGSVVFSRIRIIIRGSLIRAALLHSIQKQKRKYDPSASAPQRKCVEYETHGLLHSIRAYTPHDPIRKGWRSIRVSIAARSKSTREIKFLPPHNTAKTQNVFIIIHDNNIHCRI